MNLLLSGISAKLVLIFVSVSLRFMMVTTWISLWLGHSVELLSLLPSYQVETFWLFTLSLMARCRGEASMLPTEKYHVRNILILHCFQSHIFTWRDMRQYFTYKIYLSSFLFGIMSGGWVAETLFFIHHNLQWMRLSGPYIHAAIHGFEVTKMWFVTFCYATDTAGLKTWAYVVLVFRFS